MSGRTPWKYPNRDRSKMKPPPVFTSEQLKVEDCEICHNHQPNISKRKLKRKDGIIVEGFLCDNCYTSLISKKTVTDVPQTDRYEEEFRELEKEESKKDTEEDTGDLLLI